MRSLGSALALVVVLASAAPAAAAPALVSVGTFDEPTYVTAPAGDSHDLFVVEKPGRIRLVIDGVEQATPFLDLTADVDDDYVERGLLSMAFAPDYALSGHFFVYLTAQPDGAVQIREYTRSAVDPDVADPGSGRTLVTIAHSDAQNHNGGQLQFGPDGMLYAGTGDGGGGNDQFHHSQDPDSLLGKLLRLDPNGTGATAVARGLRNPWRFSFAPDGQVVIADVGQDNVEEVDVGLAANYGWPCLEGTRPNVSDPGCAGVATAPPVLQHTHSGDGFCAIVGGYVVTDPGLPTLLGRYVYGDDCETGLWSADLADPATDARVPGLAVTELSSFGEDGCGRLLTVSLAGPVSRVVDGTPSPCPATGSTPAPPEPTAQPQPTATAAPPSPAVTDRRPCTLSAHVSGLRSVGRRGSLSVALRSGERCRATLSGRIAGVGAFRGATATLRAGHRTVVALRLSRAAAAHARRSLARHALHATLRITAVDAAGNVRALTRTARITS